MLSALLALSLAAAAPEPHWPLAAALVLGHSLVVFDVPTRKVDLIPLGDLVPGTADLSVDRKHVVFTAHRKAGGRRTLFMADLPGGNIRELPAPPGGDVSYPRFGLGGQTVLFTSPPQPGRDGPGNRTRVRRLDLAKGVFEEIQTESDHCELAPGELARGRIAHISTTCFVSFQAEILDPATGKNRALGNVRSQIAETATSPDGKKLVYTRYDSSGLAFYLVSGGGSAKWLASVPGGSGRVQPRFVCPDNMVFTRAGAVWNLDTRSGEVTQLAALDWHEIEQSAATNARSTNPAGGTQP